MASAVIGALRVNLALDSAQFLDGLANAQSRLKGIGLGMAKIGAGMSATVTAPIVAMGLSILRTAGDFEAAMSRVGAATGASSGQMQALEDTAREMGKSTIFSAQEAADAMEILAKNGLTIEQILGGAAQGALDLAAATGSDMATAADVASDVMLSFGKNASQLTEVVNGITGVVLDSKFGIDDYRLAIGQAGGVAGSLGVEFEDFNAALTATANLFASGSDAGTSFKTFIQRLSPETKPAIEAMKELGLNFYTAEGQLKSMAGIAEELKTGLSGLSEEAKSEALTTIFGTDAMRTAVGLMNQGADGINRINTELAKASGAEQAAARLGPYAAAIEQLEGAWQEFQLTLADSGFLEAITQIVTKITEFINKMSESDPTLVKWGVSIAAIGAAVGPLLVGLGLLVTAIAAISAPVALVIAGLATLVTGLIYFKDEIYRAMEVANQWTTTVVDGMVAGVTTLANSLTSFVSGTWQTFLSAFDLAKEKLAQVKQSMVDFAASIPQIFANLAAQMVTIGGQIIQGLWDGLKSKMASVKSYLTNAVSDLAASVRSVMGIQSPSTVFAAIGSFMMQGMQLGIEEQQANVVGAAVETANMAVDSSADAWAGMREVTDEAQTGFDNLFSSIGSNIAAVIKGTKSFGEAVVDVLSQIGGMLLQSGLQSLFGSGSAAGGFIESLLGGLLGFASGGSFMVGGAGGVDSQLVAFKASPNERVSVTKPGQSDGSGGGNTTVDIRVAVDNNGQLQAYVEKVSGEQADIRVGIYDRAVLPTRVNQIRKDPHRR